VRFRKLVQPVPGAEDNLNIEPDVNDNSLLFIDFQMARVAMDRPISLDQTSEWVGEAFDFVSDPTMRLLAR
jgi:5'(3')-deoxyribonucleotidase